MADKRISDLTAAIAVQTSDLFVLEQTGTAKKLTGAILGDWLVSLADGHGGVKSFALYSTTGTNPVINTYRMTFADDSYFDIAISDGVKGDTGAQTNVYIKYSAVQPTQDSDMTDTPSPWMGIYAGLAATAPTAYGDYAWYQIKGAQGDTGNGIQSVSLYQSVGATDTYRVTFTDGTYTTFTVTNGSSIQSIAKTSTSGLTDTYTVTLTNGSTSTFTVNNGKGISSFTMVSGSHAAGTTDVYRITFNDGDTADISVYNGANGLGSVSTVSGIQADGDGDVPQVITGNGAPTQATIGQANQLYFDYNASTLYICLGESGGSYNWQGSTVTVDSALSLSSTNPVQNAVITDKVGTATLDTTATDLSGAINEHESDISGLSSKIGTGSLDTTATTLVGAVNELVPYEPLLVSWTLSSSALSHSNAKIKSTMHCVSMLFSNPSVVTSAVTCTTANGSVTLSCTLTGTTTVSLVLVKTN